MVIYKHRRSIGAAIRKIHDLHITCIFRERERPKKSLKEIVRNDVKALNLVDKIVLDLTG